MLKFHRSYSQASFSHNSLAQPLSLGLIQLLGLGLFSITRTISVWSRNPHFKMPTPLTLHRSWETLTPAGQWPKHTTHAVCPCASKFCPSAGDSPMDKDFHLPTLRTGHLQLLWNLSSNITVTRNCLLPSFHFSYLPTKPNISQLLNSFTTTGNKLPQLLFYLQRSWQ